MQTNLQFQLFPLLVKLFHEKSSLDKYSIDFNNLSGICPSERLVHRRLFGSDTTLQTLPQRRASPTNVVIFTAAQIVFMFTIRRGLN
jgi:hypothetical protein